MNSVLSVSADDAAPARSALSLVTLDNAILHQIMPILDSNDIACFALTCSTLYAFVLDYHRIRRLKELPFVVPVTGAWIPRGSRFRLLTRLRDLYSDTYVLCGAYGKFIHKRVLKKAMKDGDLKILNHILWSGWDCPCKEYYERSGCQSYAPFMRAKLEAVRQRIKWEEEGGRQLGSDE